MIKTNQTQKANNMLVLLCRLIPYTRFTCSAFHLLGNWGYRAHRTLRPRVSSASVTCVGSQIIQLSVEIIHYILDKWHLIKSLAPCGLSLASSWLLALNFGKGEAIILYWKGGSCSKNNKVGLCVFLRSSLVTSKQPYTGGLSIQMLFLYFVFLLFVFFIPGHCSKGGPMMWRNRRSKGQGAVSSTGVGGQPGPTWPLVHLNRVLPFQRGRTFCRSTALP